MPDILKLSAYFYHVCGRRNLPLKAQKSQIWAGGNAGVKAIDRPITASQPFASLDAIG